ncbi:MAG: phosphonate ABC transporter, permease protein PhnE [Methylobacteriaceae bacterium]|nr:phosphonate ABC transporter, permease protein PhnE [Methylobacteriaceae bacterium]
MTEAAIPSAHVAAPSLRQAALAGRAGLLARHPGVFTPNWRRRGATVATLTVLALLLVCGFASLDVSWSRIVRGLGRLGEFALLMLPPSFGTFDRLELYLLALAQTLAIAFLGTLLAALLALPFGFLAARNVIPNVFAHFVVRRVLDTIRAVDVLIWALIWINVVGLGPFAGILAIMTSDWGAFGKLFSEAVEAADRRAVDGIVSTGGSKLHAVRFGLVPQVLPVFLSQVLYFFESNTRSATIIGIVGAGGIGQLVAGQIMVLEWQHVAFLVLLVLVTVAIIDALSSRLRFAIIGAPARAG